MSDKPKYTTIQRRQDRAMKLIMLTVPVVSNSNTIQSPKKA